MRFNSKIVTLVLLGVLAFNCHGNQAEKKEEKARLQARLDHYLDAIQKMNADSLQAYTYPRIFSLISPAAFNEEFNKVMVAAEGGMKIGSVRTDSICPVHYLNNGQYTMIYYTVTIHMKSSPSEINNLITEDTVQQPASTHSIGEKYAAPQETLMRTLIKANYGIEITGYENKNGVTIMTFRLSAIAAKDNYSKEWTFLTVTNDEAFQQYIKNLFPNNVLEALTADNPK